jgi:hypothetical protein
MAGYAVFRVARFFSKVETASSASDPSGHE